jgi:hypothetical protein
VTQLPESNIPPAERLIRIREAVAAGCDPAELYTDVEVCLSVFGRVAPGDRRWTPPRPQPWPEMLRTP